MADDAQRIRVEILATAAQFREELDSAISKLAGPGGLKQAIKDVPNRVTTDFQMETAGAHTKLGKLRDAIRDTKTQIDRDASFGLDTAAARLKLAALERQADQVKRKIAEDAALSMVGGAGGGGAGGLLGGIPGSGGGAGIGLVTAALPIIVATGGALTALAGSLGAAALGFGALATAAAGAATVGLGAVAAVVVPAVSSIKTVSDATDKLRAAQEKYGAGSKQAAQAQHDLNDVVAKAPPGAAAAAGAIDELGKAWDKLSRPAQATFFRILNEGLSTLSGLLPTIASVAKTALDAIDTGLKPVLAGLSSPEFKAALVALAGGFAELAPPLIEAFAEALHALVNIAIAGLPYVVEIAKAFLKMTQGWVSATSDGKKLGGTIGGLVGQFKAWWGLASTLGHLLVTIFGAGASAGQGLVGMLTQILGKWNAWLNTTAGQAALKAFFTDAKNLVTALFSALGPVIGAVAKIAIELMPAFGSALGIVGGVLKGVAGVLGAVVHWLVEAHLASGILAGGLIVLAAAWAIGKVLAFIEAIKTVVSVVKALMILIAENPFGAFIAVLGLAGAALGIFGGHEEKAKTTAEDATNAINAQRDALKALHDVGLETDQANLSRRQAATALAVAQRQLSHDKHSGADSLQIAQDTNAVAQAELDLARAKKAVNEQAAKNTETEGKAAAQAAKTATTLKNRQTSIEGSIGSLKDEVKQWEEEVRLNPFLESAAKKLAGKKAELAREEKNLATNTRREGEAQRQAALAAEGSVPAFDKLQRKIETLWAEGAGATKKGTEEINGLIAKELKILVPVVGGEAKSVLKAITSWAGGGYIGQEGERGHDEVPIVVGRGEAILHAGHQAVVNQALAETGRGDLAQVFKNTGGLHYNMAAGGYAGGGMVVRGPASTFGPPGEPAGSTAYGSSSADPGIAVNPHGGGAWNDSLANSLAGKVAKVILGSHSASLKVIDKGPSASGAHGPRLIDITGAGARAMGIDPGGFPTDSIAEAIFGEGGAAVGATGVPAVKIKMPPWAGPRTGAIAAIGKAALAKEVKAANEMLARFAPAPSGGGGVGGPVGPAGGVAGVGTFDGIQVAKWIIPELEYARAHGWTGHITSGYRPGFDRHTASGKSEHQLTQYPGGAIDFGGIVDPAGLANREAFMRAAAGYTGPRVIPAQGFRDDGHASGTGHAAGGFAGMMAVGGFAGGGTPPVASSAKTKKGSKPPSRPPAKPRHAKAKPFRWTKDPKFLPADIRAVDQQITSWQEGAAAKDTAYQHLLDSQALVPTEPLVTLSDADVKFMDPTGTLGYQAGDQLVNQAGMTVGRFFGPGGIQGGKFIAGIDTRQGQISGLLGLLGEEDSELTGEDTADKDAIDREEKAQAERHARAVRVRKTLATIVARAKKINERLEALKTGDLKANLKAALSRKAIAERKGELTAHLRELRADLAAETAHQAKLIPADKETGYSESLRAQIAGVSQAASKESDLEREASSSKGVAKAHEAILKDSLGHQAKLLAAQITAMGGGAAGTGGLLGRLKQEAEALRTDQGGHINDRKDLATKLYAHGQERGALEREQKALPGTSAIQVRTPGAGGGTATTEALLALTQQELANTQKDLAVSQAQFAVFKGFAPLLAGRLVGTFAHGVDRVSRTGPALVHQGEVILPDPDGPYGNRAAAQARGGSDQPIQIHLHFAGDSGKLVKLVDARINERGLRLVSDKAGQRSRLMAGVTHR